MTAENGSAVRSGTALRPSRGIRVARVLLLIGGIALLVVGGVVLGQEVRPTRYLGILTWFIGALILHDAIIAPLVVLVSLIGRRMRIAPVVQALVQAGLVLAGIVTLLVVPEILKQRIKVASSSILPQDYLTHLVVYLVVIAALTALAVMIYRAIARSARRRAQNTRPASSQS